jgi:hypothetical protein
MATDLIRLINSILQLTTACLFLVACAAPQLVVPSSDPTPPSAVWLQIDVPGRPLLNADLTSASPPASVAGGQTARVSARADDPDGGVQDIQIWMTEESWSVDPVTGLAKHTGPGLAGAPSASSPSAAKVGEPAPASANTSFTLQLPIVSAPQSRKQIVLWARALNFHGGKSNTKQLAN